jgi:hypothetical protein
MTTKEAREVLSRCEYFAKTLREDPTGVAWEAQFSAALALLRGVGHALDKSKTEQWWKHLKSKKNTNSIFWDFIDNERNLILKEAQLRAGQSAFVYLQGVQVTALAAGQLPAPPPATPQQRKTDYSYHMNDGVFAGRDPRDLIDEAITWWKGELSKIDTETRAEGK